MPASPIKRVTGSRGAKKSSVIKSGDSDISRSQPRTDVRSVALTDEQRVVCALQQRCHVATLTGRFAVCLCSENEPSSHVAKPNGRLFAPVCRVVRVILRRVQSEFVLLELSCLVYTWITSAYLSQPGSTSF